MINRAESKGHLPVRTKPSCRVLALENVAFRAQLNLNTPLAALCSVAPWKPLPRSFSINKVYTKSPVTLSFAIWATAALPKRTPGQISKGYSASGYPVHISSDPPAPCCLRGVHSFLVPLCSLAPAGLVLCLDTLSSCLTATHIPGDDTLRDVGLAPCRNLSAALIVHVMLLLPLIANLHMSTNNYLYTNPSLQFLHVSRSPVLASFLDVLISTLHLVTV
jgi:hypothetical protein